MGVVLQHCDLIVSLRVASYSALKIYDISVAIWRFATISLTALPLSDSYTDWGLAAIAVAWRLPLSHKLRRLHILFYFLSCRLCVFYPLSHFPLPLHSLFFFQFLSLLSSHGIILV